MAERAGNNFQVSATGGAGSSGQPKQYIPGMKSLGSSGVETMAQQSGASMYKEPTSTEPTLPAVSEIGAPSAFPGQPVTDGAPMGAGVNSIPGLPQEGPIDPDMEMAREYFPILEFWASQPGSSQGTKDYVKYLGTIL
jgi:hypothetical protein